MPREALQEALCAVNEALCTAVAIGEALRYAGGDNVPPVVHVYQGQIAAVLATFEALEAAVHAEVRDGH